MHAVAATVSQDVSHQAPPSQPPVQTWLTFIRAMEVRHAARVRHTPAEAHAVAAWAARLDVRPPGVPA